jgi:crotonobetainyl-CoA:carnitine CoA-transferase CaiB-like acyl-CoA transferase
VATPSLDNQAGGTALSGKAVGSNGSFLNGVRVVELADELGEYCGKVLAGLGADVIKVEPPGGEKTRGYGPFYHDEPHPNRSLHFWHYNFGKRGVVLDLESEEDKQHFMRLAQTADIVLDTRPRNYLNDRGIGYDTMRGHNSSLIYARISPYGDDGPWADYQGTDLVHLALGGVMMNCGYDPDPFGFYETPPIAPQAWQSYQVAGEVTAVQIIAALVYRLKTGRGQHLSTSVHDAVSKNTETDLPDWVYCRLPHYRQTCRHSLPSASPTMQGVATESALRPGLSRTKDGRWVLAYRTYLLGGLASFDATVRVLRKFGAEGDLCDEKYKDEAYVLRPTTNFHIATHVERLVGRYLFERDLWKDGQDEGLPWSPVRRPEENVGEEHWAQRETFFQVAYPELCKIFTQVGAKWVAPGLPWRNGPRAPLLGEHNEEVLAAATARKVFAPCSKDTAAADPPRFSKHRKPFALSGVRIVDLTWMLASAGAGRFFTALGAEVIKVEHLSRLDGMRMGMGNAPLGGRAERDAATEPLVVPATKNVNRSGSFMEINAGKRGISLNLKHPRAKDLLIELIKGADMVIEGFSPGTMDRMGLGYDRLREINPRIIYVQQSGMGQIGTYGRLRSFGPTAQAFSGLSDMSGLPGPYPPAGIGYSYLDWFGAYQMALAMMAALYRQRETGQGCWIDSSQAEVGIYLTGASILDHSVNGRHWARYGNRSPYKPAAPHSAYRARGEDRWIAIAAFSDDQWWALTRVLGTPHWAADPRLATLSIRLANQDYLDRLMNETTVAWDAFELMHALQRAGVPAGVCQTAEDRYEHDPQLRHLGWMTELEQSEIGRWPVKEVPVKFSETPPYIGGFLDRHGPSYGEDNEYVLRTILGLDEEQIERLAQEGAF